MQNSKIEWTDHTFNPWWGCQRVSPGCEHCYAETLAHRYNFRVWGPAKTTGRREMSANYWRQPLRWNEAARKAGERKRVFCASMADVFEDHPGVDWPRVNLWGLIEQTEHLDWLLLTKRPENIERFVPREWLDRRQENVKFGFSAESQEYFNRRWQEAKYMARRGYTTFVSAEPLLGPINLNPWDGFDNYLNFGARAWVIAGGESGHGARPINPAWVRSLRDQCEGAGVPFFFKQWGEYAPVEYMQTAFQHSDEQSMARVGKHAAGRLLDGRTWDELPL
jgi:protein gp37